MENFIICYINVFAIIIIKTQVWFLAKCLSKQLIQCPHKGYLIIFNELALNKYYQKDIEKFVIEGLKCQKQSYRHQRHRNSEVGEGTVL